MEVREEYVVPAGKIVAPAEVSVASPAKQADERHKEEGNEEMAHFDVAKNMLALNRDRPVVALGITFPPPVAYDQYQED